MRSGIPIGRTTNHMQSGYACGIPLGNPVGLIAKPLTLTIIISNAAIGHNSATKFSPR